MNSRITLIVGILLVAAGGLALYFGGIPQETEVIRFGGKALGYTDTRKIPEWLSGAVIGIGAVLVILGFIRKK